jgi:hypothetical protein
MSKVTKEYDNIRDVLEEIEIKRVNNPETVARSKPSILPEKLLFQALFPRPPEKLLFHARFPSPPEKLLFQARFPSPPEKLLFQALLPRPPEKLLFQARFPNPPKINDTLNTQISEVCQSAVFIRPQLC